MNSPKYLFQVFVDGELCDVYSREETHMMGETNNTPNNWWAFVRGEWVPWCDLGANRPVWDLRFTQSNYTKTKYDFTTIRGSGKCCISCNTRIVYSFLFNSLDWAMAKAKVLMVEMLEHIFPFTEPDKALGMKVWFYEQPAIISGVHLELDGSVMLKKDGEGGFDLNKPWWNRDDGDDEWNGSDEVRTDIFDSNINWFRD